MKNVHRGKNCTKYQYLRKASFLTCTLLIIIMEILTGCKNQVTYTVEFDSQGGSSIESQSIKENDCIIKPDDPIKPGFTFVEWRYGEEKFNFDEPISSNMKLTAFYNVEEGTKVVLVTFDADNSSSAESIETAAGYPITAPPNPKKDGYVFSGWYVNNAKFDFSTAIIENIVLTANWSAVQNNQNTSTNNSNINRDNGSYTNSTQAIINFESVKGTWYAEGTNDVTLTFSLDGDRLGISGLNFNTDNCTISYLGGTGSIQYGCDGTFYAPYITLVGTDKLIYSKNGKVVTFYRTADYPKHIPSSAETLVKDIDGYYWYLDGYSYAYLHPTVNEWNGDKCLSWKSENIDISDGKLSVLENLSYSEYSPRAAKASADCPNSLLVNPLRSAHKLIYNYDMKVANNKLYMTVGGIQYSFTRYSSLKIISPTLMISKNQVTVSSGDSFELGVSIYPFCYNSNLNISSSNRSVVLLNSCGGGDNYQTIVEFNTLKSGTATITLEDSISGVKKTVSVTVNGDSESSEPSEPSKPSEVKVTGISLNKATLQLIKGGSETLAVTVLPVNATNKNVTWSSSNPSVATISNTGKISAVGLGTTTILAKTNDGAFSSSCTVTVKEKPLTVSADIGLTTFSSNGEIIKGIFVSVRPSGGSESYTAYSIKVYYNDQFVAENNKKEMILTPQKAGTYRAEIYVKDSNGNESTNTVITKISF